MQHKLPTTQAVVRRFELGRTAWFTVLSRYGFRIDEMFDIPVVAAQRQAGTHEGELGELSAAGGDPQASPFGRQRPSEGCPGPRSEVAHQ